MEEGSSEEEESQEVQHPLYQHPRHVPLSDAEEETVKNEVAEYLQASALATSQGISYDEALRVLLADTANPNEQTSGEIQDVEAGLED